MTTYTIGAGQYDSTLEACGVSLTGRASVASARRGSGMAARCRHARTVVTDALEVCIGCDRVRPASDRGVVYRWRAAIGEEGATASAARAAHPRRGTGAPLLPPGQRRDVELRVRLRPGELDALDALAARWGVSRSDAVREALTHARATLHRWPFPI